MSVIVKGMEMPTVCIEGGWYGNCPMDRLWCAQRFAPEGYTMGQINADRQDKLPEWCPLRPMPEKHGRLIDADVLHKLYESRWHDLQVLNWDENPHAEDIQTGVNWCINSLHDDAPTIVEAEGE